MQDEQVNIELKMNNITIDLRVPKMVRMPHLKQVITEALKMARLKTPTNFELTLNQKPIKIFETTVLNEYSFGDGDQLEIKT